MHMSNLEVLVLKQHEVSTPVSYEKESEATVGIGWPKLSSWKLGKKKNMWGFTSTCCSWHTGMQPDKMACCEISTSRFDVFWDAFLLTVVVESGYMNYRSLPVGSNQFLHSPLISLISKAFLVKDLPLTVHQQPWHKVTEITFSWDHCVLCDFVYWAVAAWMVELIGV